MTNSTADVIAQFKNVLRSLDGCMKKASAYADRKKFDVNVLVLARLAPDMMSFDEQIQSACDAAKFAAAALSEQKAPSHEDNETTWAQLHARIATVLAYLETFKASDFENAPSTIVKPGWAKGKSIPGSDYIQQIAIPNFYFHVMIAYAILRHNGVDIGKLDYMGEVNLRD